MVVWRSVVGCYIDSFFVQKVYFGPDNFTGCVEFVLGVCNDVSSNCY